jgi:hypothetical protein
MRKAPWIAMHGNLLLATGTDSAALLHDGEDPCAGHRGILFTFFFLFVLSICFFISRDLGFFVFQLFLQLPVSGIAWRRHRRWPRHELWGAGRPPVSVNNSLGLSGTQTTRTTANIKKQKSKEIFITNPQWGRGQRHGGAFPAGTGYIAKVGRRVVPLPRRLPHQDLPFTTPRAGGRCGGCW